MDMPNVRSLEAEKEAMIKLDIFREIIRVHGAKTADSLIDQSEKIWRWVSESWPKKSPIP